MKGMRSEDVDALKLKYPKGTRVRLISMSDAFTCLTEGDAGTVSCVDDIGTIHVDWDSGSSLGLIPGHDRFRVL
jgi:hypothetical protein